ncbi:MAG: hypothetical protein CM1200mP39_21510 [Dehalococcoidia bacterium]|nr:MAG: hypothetical protein CM1200mP39_21510 [Dehalococcoidia bacterium]
MEVGYDEVSVLLLESVGGDACITPLSPPMVNIAINEIKKQHSRLS